MLWQIDWPTVQIWLQDHGPQVILIILVSILFILLFNLSTRGIQAYIELRVRKQDRREEILRRATTLSRITRRVTRILVIFVAGVLILFELGINITPILAGAGIVGVAVGFGAQKLIADFLNGFFVLLENQYRVGDVVSAAGVSGEVEAVNMRTTVIRDLEGRVHTIPNSELKVVTNHTKEFSRYVLDIGVAYKEDVDHVMEVLRAVGEALYTDEKFGPDILEMPEVLGLQDFADSAVVIRTRLKTKTLAQWDIAREFRRRVKIAFDKEGIEIPFPHRTVYYGDAGPAEDAPPSAG